MDGLNGLAWMAREAPGDREAVEWLRTHAVDGAVLAEATGNAYTDYSRIGGATGLPIVLGWDNHEGLWRGGAVDGRARGPPPGPPASSTRPRTPTPSSRCSTATRVRYVFLGSFERRDFGVNAFPLRANFRRAFDSKNTVVYEILK